MYVILQFLGMSLAFYGKGWYTFNTNSLEGDVVYVKYMARHCG